MKRKKSRRESSFYKFAVPVVTLVSTVAAVVVWNYSSTKFQGKFAGYSASGRMAEVYRAFFGEPAILLIILGILFLMFAAFAALNAALREKRQGAVFLTVLLAVTAAAFVAIIFTAITDIAS